jgi:molybdopterin synthase catalytic subunit
MENHFTISRFSINPSELSRSVQDFRAGAMVTFEGWVRNQNENKEVTALEYECFESLAVKEGDRILHEAIQRFSILNAKCVHRVGKLDLGAVAVWVGVVSKHRQPAFESCEYIINELKVRVPIWKKEYYADGDSGWVHCKTCAHHTRVLS